MKCKLEKYENTDNIFSTSFFILKKGYKNVDIYTNGLLMLAKYVRDDFPDFKLRIYYDKSLELSGGELVSNTILELKKMQHVQLIKYECPDFITDFGHQDLFGTFIRFLPLFNEDSHKMIVVSDIDIDDNFKKDISYCYNNFKNEKEYKFAYITHNCYKKPWTKMVDYPIMAGSFLSKIKFPMEILANFMRCFNSKNSQNNSDICNKIKNISNDIKKDEWFKVDKDMKILFGMDEFFMNHYVLDYMNKNKIKYMVFLRKSLAPLKKIKRIENKTELYNFVSMVLGNKYQKNKTLFINTQLMFDIIYDKKNGHDIILKKLISVLHEYKKNKKIKNIGLTDDDYECIVSQDFDSDYKIIKMD